MAAYQTMELLRRDIAVAGETRTQEAELARIGVRIALTDSLTDIEPVWRALEALGIDSPGQSFDFLRIWTETFAIPRLNQAYVAVEIGGRPLMVMAFERRNRLTAKILVPFAGAHVGVNAPLVDRARMALLSLEDRKAIWSRIRRALGADLLNFGRVLGDDLGLLPGAVAVPSDTLYRTEFDNWEACDREQRTRSRRKHDKQQGQKLAALGTVGYEEIAGAEAATPAINVLFADRATRFAEQGIPDPFVAPEVRAFYRSVFAGGLGLHGRMQVLRLDDRIVAARYNLVSGSRMFCLISSMSTDPVLQPGSPGKQILVHLMQSIFVGGIASFDMGAGLTDEKRHWCNIQLPLCEASMPATLRGQAVAFLFAVAPRAKHWVKSKARLFAALKSLRARLKT